jgi:multidrug efflux system outer membrane protein
MSRFSTLILTATVASSALLAGCAIGPAVGPNYEQPALTGPLHWLGFGQNKAQVLWSDAAKADLNAAWWEDFNDTTLTALMSDALVKNGDLQVALARVDEARGARLTANAAMLPQVNGQADTARSRSAQTGTVGTYKEAVADASWEIDLFGGKRRAAEAARANLGSARAEARLARVRLLAEVAGGYMDVRGLQQQLADTRRSLETQAETLKLLEAQEQEGIGSTLASLQARAQWADTAAAVPQLEAQLQSSIYSLGVLTGHTPIEIQAIMGDVKPVPVSSRTVLVATPARVIANRPDVQSAERALAAATANKGVAIASWFPQISLTGLYGVASSAAVGTTHPWTLGGAATLPIIDFGSVRGMVRQADARQRAALATYEQTVNAALADVETSLTAYLKAAERADKLEVAAKANADALNMAKAQQAEGVASTLDVLTAEQRSLAADSALSQGRADVGKTLATLYKALGGGQY